MCYDVTSATKHKLKYAKHRREKPEEIAALEKELDRWLEQMPVLFHASGFSHPHLMVFTQEAPFTPQAMQWGLIPSWVRNREQANDISNQTLNARAETLMEKASFRQSVRNRRCLIYVDGFYEHHHHQKKIYPYHILMQDDSPMALAGIYDRWTDKESGEIFETVTIITTQGNELMSGIHNHPKAQEARMPVILPKDKQDEWLAEMNEESLQEAITRLLIPCESNVLRAYTVKRLRGKEALGNVKEAEDPFVYVELENANPKGLFDDM